MYLELFKRLGLTQVDMKPSKAPLILSSALNWPLLEMMTLKIQAGTQKLETEFVVVDLPSPYNAIVGRDCVRRMNGVASTLHQVIKFANPRERRFSMGIISPLHNVTWLSFRRN